MAELQEHINNIKDISDNIEAVKGYIRNVKPSEIDTRHLNKVVLFPKHKFTKHNGVIRLMVKPKQEIIREQTEQRDFAFGNSYGNSSLARRTTSGTFEERGSNLPRVGQCLESFGLSPDVTFSDTTEEEEHESEHYQDDRHSTTPCVEVKRSKYEIERNRDIQPLIKGTIEALNHKLKQTTQTLNQQQNMIKQLEEQTKQQQNNIKQLEEQTKQQQNNIKQYEEQTNKQIEQTNENLKNLFMCAQAIDAYLSQDYAYVEFANNFMAEKQKEQQQRERAANLNIKKS